VNLVFYVSSAIAIISTVLAISRTNAVHALLFLVVSLLSIALIFLSLGAPFIAALEVIVYAGAIMVLFVFVVMMLNLGEQAAEQERRWLSAGIWFLPAVFAAVLVIELAYSVMSAGFRQYEISAVGPKEIGIVLYGPYVLAVELGSMLLLSGLIGAYHLGRTRREVEKREP